LFLDPPLSPIHAIDLALCATIALALPAYAFIEHRRDVIRELQGRIRPLLWHYRQTIIVLWSLTALVLAVWLMAGRSFASLGLGASADWRFLAAIALSLAGSALYGLQVVTVARSPSARAQLASILQNQGGVRSVLPRTHQEMWCFRWLSLTAGFTEELLFRGFLIWAFAHWMPIWSAAACALGAFILAHLYQESWRALLGVTVAGAAATALVLLSGSLLPAMIAHAAIDLTGGEMAWLARREISHASQTAPANEEE